MAEALHSVGVSASFLAFVVLVLNVKLKLGMFSDSSSSKIVMSDKKQGAAFHFVLHKFVLKCSVKDGWRLHGILDEESVSPFEVETNEFKSAALEMRRNVKINLRRIIKSKQGKSYRALLSAQFFDAASLSSDEEEEEEEDEEEEEENEEYEDEEDENNDEENNDDDDADSDDDENS